MTEYLGCYEGAPWMFSVSIMEFVNEKVAREPIYVMEGFAPADGRAAWRAEQPADPPPPPPS
ncbi:hypothetical protein ACOCJ4_16485 [Knoellia sp. CPCC 206435]|uniref:hypothetical protein n=1 Tax=Knoellia terrae TaxID=3404797 RepID=UPI003B43D627